MNNNYAKVDKLETLPQEDYYSGVYIFISCDLVNATEYKIRYSKWYETFEQFYEGLIRRVIGNDSPLENAKVWKLIGDEVLFYLRVTDVNEIYLAIPYLLKITKEVEEDIQKSSVSHDKLFIKTVVWMAHIENHTSENNTLSSQNRYYLPKGDMADSNIDFLGFQIDEGFRIGKFARQNVVVVGASLALFLLQQQSEADTQIKDHKLWKNSSSQYKIENKIQTIIYEKLKGIWRGHYYPIIWYCDSWESKNIYQYDEQYDDITKKYIDITNKINKDTSTLNEIKSIFTDINLQNPDFKDIISKSKKYTPEIDKKSEIHVTLICTNSTGDKILLAHRDKKRNRFPNMWEFGCGYIKKNETYEKAIQRTYKEKFGLEVKLLDTTPISTYSFKKHENTIVNGLIFIGRVDKDKIVSNAKYQQVEFKILKDIKKLEKSQCIDNLQENAKVGMRKIQQAIKK